MADEVYVTNNGNVLATHILYKKRLEMLLSQQPFMRRLCAFRGDTVGSGSTTVKVSQMADDAVAEPVAEGAAPLANAPLNDDAYTLAPGRQAVKQVLSDLMGGINAFGIDELALATMQFNAVMRAFDALVCSAVSGLDGTVGSAGATFSVDDWYEANQLLDERLVVGKRAALLHNFQWSNLQSDLRGETGALAFNADVQDSLRVHSGKNLKGHLNGVQVWTSSQVADAGGGTVHDGCIIQIPEDSEELADGKYEGDAAFSFAEGSQRPSNGLVPGRIVPAGTAVYSHFSGDGLKAESLVVTNYFAAVGAADPSKGVKVRTQHSA